MIDDIKWVLVYRQESSMYNGVSYSGGEKVLMVKSNNEWKEVRTEERFEEMETSSQGSPGRVENTNNGESLPAK